MTTRSRRSVVSIALHQIASADRGVRTSVPVPHHWQQFAQPEDSAPSLRLNPALRKAGGRLQVDYATRSMRTLFSVTGVRGRSLESRGTLEILSAISWPSTTSPKIECLLSSQGVAATVRKNWLPLVPGPALAIESLPALLCFSDG